MPTTLRMALTLDRVTAPTTVAITIWLNISVILETYMYKVLDCIYFKTRRGRNISIFKKWLVTFKFNMPSIHVQNWWSTKVLCYNTLVRPIWECDWCVKEYYLSGNSRAVFLFIPIFPWRDDILTISYLIILMTRKRITLALRIIE